MLRFITGCAAFLLLPGLLAGQVLSNTPAGDSLLHAARTVVDSARYCALITIADSGEVDVRAMDPFTPEQDWTVWLATNPQSRKVAQIRRNPGVTLYYFDRAGGGYVSLRGRAQIIDDKAKKVRYWKDEWEPFYPDREQGYLLIKVRPLSMEVVSEALGVLGDPDTWQPQKVLFTGG